MKKNIFFLFVISLFIFGCSPKITTEVAKTSAKTATVTDTQLVEGKNIYTTKCGVGGYGGYGNCHSLYTVSRFTKQEWKHTVPEMAPRAKLTAAEEKLVLLYVLSGAKK